MAYIFVEYLNRHKGGNRLKLIDPRKGDSQRLPSTIRHTDTETVAYEVATARYGSTCWLRSNSFRWEYARVNVVEHDRQTEVIIARFLNGLYTENSLSAEMRLHHSI